MPKHPVHLDFNKSTHQDREEVKVRVGDAGQILSAYLTDDGIPVQPEGDLKIQIKRPDGGIIRGKPMRRVEGNLYEGEIPIPSFTYHGIAETAYVAEYLEGKEGPTTTSFKLVVLPGTTDESMVKYYDEDLELLKSNLSDDVEANKQSFAAAQKERAEEFERTQKENASTFEASEREREETFEAAEAKREEGETARKEAEQGRVTAEQGRAAAETAREESEGERETAEASRETAESERDSAEQDRQSNETERQSEEAKRAAAEVQRGTDEDSRKEAEQGRVDAESKRVEAEKKRSEAEQGRVDAEASRVGAETERDSAETARDEAETQRETAEKARNESEVAREAAEDERETAEAERESNEVQRKASEQDRDAAETLRGDAERERSEAEQGRVTADTDRADRQDANDKAQLANNAAQAKNNADQKANNEAAFNHQFITLQEGEFDPDTRKPTIADPKSGPVYRVPKETPSETNKYDEWYWALTTDGVGEWEAWTATQIAEAPPIPTDKIDRIVAGNVVSGDEVMKTDQLSYYDAAVKERTATAIGDAVGAQAEAQKSTDEAQDKKITAAQEAAEKASGDLETYKTAQGKTDSAQDEAIEAAKQRADEAYNHIPDLVSKTASGILPAFPGTGGPLYPVALDGVLKGWQVIPAFSEGVAGLVPGAPSPDEGEKVLLNSGWGDYKGGGMPDYRPLKAAIAAANAAKDAAKVKGGGDYDFGTPVTTQAAIDTLTTAITAAQKVYDAYDDPDTTQDTLDTATSTLNAALQTFNATCTPLVADKSGFTAQETRYNGLKDGVSTPTDGKDVPFGSKWVTASEASAADTALSTARSAVNSATKQSQINSAVTTLTVAIDTYQAAIKTATKDTAALDAAVSAANAAKADVSASDQEGADLPAGSNYVTSAQMKALTDAIGAATTAKESGTTQKQLDDATSALTKATETFKSQVKQNVSIYGVDFSGFPTSTKGTRTDAAANLGDPKPAVGAGSGSSPFDSIFPWSEIQRETRSGNEMVKIPKFYYKLEQSGNGVKVQIATGKVDGFEVSPAHADRSDGKGEREYVYVGRYHTSTGYKSVSKVNPLANITRNDARTGSKGTANFYQLDYATRFTIQLLYLVEFADFNSQAKIGGGCSTSGSVMQMGYTDTMTYHTGTTAASIGAAVYGGTQYRFMEGLWDNVYDWLDGCRYDSQGLHVIVNPAEFSDTSGGKLVGLPVAGYPSKLGVSKTGGFTAFYPTEASGSDSTGTCDGWGFNASYPCLYVGGYYVQNRNHGLFYVYCNAASNKGADRGSRLLELP